MDRIKDRFESSDFGEEILGEVDYDLLETTKERKRREREERERQRQLEREAAEHKKFDKKYGTVKPETTDDEEEIVPESDEETEYVDFEDTDSSINTREFVLEIEEEEIEEYDEEDEESFGLPDLSGVNQEEFVDEPGTEYEEESALAFEPEHEENDSEPELDVDESEYEYEEFELDEPEQEPAYVETVEEEPEQDTFFYEETEDEQSFDEPEEQIDFGLTQDDNEEDDVGYDDDNMNVYDSSAYDDDTDFMEVSEDEEAKESWLDKATGLLNKAKAGIAKKEKKSVHTEEEKSPRNERFKDSVFDVNDDEVDEVINEISSQSQKTHEDRINAAYDILEVLNIQETFSISQDYFIPADLDAVTRKGFSLESPLGFDRKEVQRFFNKVSRTIQYYTRLLEQRNRDVMTLSAEIDKRDDLLEKTRYDQEIAQGISVMPTVDDTQTENELFESRLEIQRLRKELDKAQKQLQMKATNTALPDLLSEDERAQHNALQDDYRKLLRERDSAVEEVRELRIQVAKYQEDEQPDYMAGFMEQNSSTLPDLPEKKDSKSTGLPDL